MKNTLLALIALTTLTCNLSFAETKTAVVDMNKIFKEYFKTEEAEKEITDMMNGYKKDHDERMADYQKLVEQIKELQEAVKDPSLSESARKERESKLKDKVGEARTREREISEFRNTTNKLRMDKQKNMREKIVVEINETIEKIAKGKYNMVFDKSGMNLSGVPTLVFADGVTDISSEVISSLNKGKN
ncbi:MAG: OmpH family outer membrane protein [Verrucomicrobiota bacterium]